MHIENLQNMQKYALNHQDGYQNEELALRIAKNGLLDSYELKQ